MSTFTTATRPVTFSGKGAIPAGVTVGSFKSVLYVHDGSGFLTIGQVGNLVKLKVSAEYPAAGLLPKTMETRWTHDTTAVATEMARRINSCPVLEQKIASMQRTQDELVAKLKMAQSALLQAPALQAGASASFAHEIGLTLKRFTVESSLTYRAQQNA